MISSHTIIKALLHTEKTTLYYQPQAKYLFLVDKTSNKIQIKRAIEELYKVKVKDVNIFVSGGKLKRVRHQLGRTPDIKKAIVTLKEGQKIEVA